MKKFRTEVSLLVMIVAAAVGFFFGASVSDGWGGAILFAMIAGIACLVYTIDNRDDENKSDS